jgi:hypothetical protein
MLLSMIFCNMKYLFYNCQLLLLCCACCKFAIQVFVQEDRHTINKKIASFTDGYTDGHILVGISQRVAKKLRHFATITDGYTNGHAIITDVYINAFTNRWCTNRSARLSEFTDGRGKTNARVF